MPPKKASRKVHTGPRGGRYTIHAGKKRYISSSKGSKKPSKKKTGSKKKPSKKKTSSKKKTGSKKMSKKASGELFYAENRSPNSPLYIVESAKSRTRHTASPDLHTRDVPRKFYGRPVRGIDGNLWVVNVGSNRWMPFKA